MTKIAPTVFIEGAREWLGAPFLIGGRNKEGVDCASFLLETAKHLGVIGDFVPKPYGYRELRDRNFLRNHIRRFCDKVDTAKPGDILIFNMGGRISHCGLQSDETHVIHVMEGYGCVEVTLPGSWERRISDIFRPRFYWQP